MPYFIRRPYAETTALREPKSPADEVDLLDLAKNVLSMETGPAVEGPFRLRHPLKPGDSGTMILELALDEGTSFRHSQPRGEQPHRTGFTHRRGIGSDQPIDHHALYWRSRRGNRDGTGAARRASGPLYRDPFSDRRRYIRDRHPSKDRLKRQPNALVFQASRSVMKSRQCAINSRSSPDAPANADGKAARAPSTSLAAAWRA